MNTAGDVNIKKNILHKDRQTNQSINQLKNIERTQLHKSIHLLLCYNGDQSFA